MDKLLTVHEAAQFLNITQGALYAMKQRGQGPAYIRIGRRIRYRRDQLQKWLDELEVEPRRPRGRPHKQ